MYIDFHTHLDFHKKEKLNDAIDDINTNRINTIACSMDINSYLYNLELSKQSKYIIPAFGIHPWKAYENINQLNEIEKYM